MFELERAQDPEHIEEIIISLIRVLEEEGQLTALGRYFANWIAQVLPVKHMDLPDTHFDSMLDVKSMLAENMRKWRENFERQTIERVTREVEEKVAKETMVETSMKLMTLKFGPSPTREELLASCTIQQLEVLLEHILDAQDEDVLLQAVTIQPQ